MEGIKHEIGYIYNETAKAIHEGETIVVHKGGTGSGKTYEIMLFLVLEVALHQDLKGKKITIASESYPHIYGGAFKDFKDIMQVEGIWQQERFNQQRMTYTFHTGNYFEFVSTDRVGRALGHRRFLLYVNEVNNNKREVVDEMSRRSRYVLYDFNPTAQFYLEDMLQYYGQYKIIKSNVHHNAHIDPVEKARIVLRASMDPNFKRVHIDCEYGSSEGLVYPDFTIIDTFPVSGIDRVVYGLDWGYTNDPTVLLMVGINKRDVYIDELIYQTGLSNAAIIAKLEQWKFSKSQDLIFADVNPKDVDAIAQAGFSIRQVSKPPGSLEHWVRKIRDEYKIHVTKRSINTIKEYRGYHWLTDKAGQAMNVPAKGNDHAMDAKRYAIMGVETKKPLQWM